MIFVFAVMLALLFAVAVVLVLFATLAFVAIAMFPVVVVVVVAVENAEVLFSDLADFLRDVRWRAGAGINKRLGLCCKDSSERKESGENEVLLHG